MKKPTPVRKPRATRNPKMIDNIVVDKDTIWVRREPPPIAAEPTVTITLTLEQAEDISHGLSDAGCWMTGFEAAGKDRPYGREAIVRMNLQLKAAIRAAGGKVSGELPF